MRDPSSTLIPYEDVNEEPNETADALVSTEARQLSRHREAWRQEIDRKLIEWGRDPSQFEDVDLIPPTQEAIRVASRIALQMMDCGAAPPTAVVPDGDGGIVIERRTPTTVESIEVTREGAAEMVRLLDGRVADRRAFSVGNG
ncbi:MAG: hypothetical protein FLDDKLPJ_00280 [Phycisphaerae bacterium]|nr:hypothetical protein [Phycisphaerae bacterium]